VRVEVAGAQVTNQCEAEARALSSGRLRTPIGARLSVVPYWIPRYYGPPIRSLVPGLAPPLTVVPVYGPHLVLSPGARPSVSSGWGGGSLNLGGGGRDAGYLLIALAVIALIVLPTIGLAMSLSDPTADDQTVDAIDWLNAYQDLARTPGSPCSPYAAKGAP
jgi:hypothetical protein